jgi:hypothetical protein
VDRCKEMYLELESGKAQVNATTDPLDWSHVNFEFEAEIEDKFSLTAQPSLGFLFRARVKTVRAFERECSKVMYCSELPSEEEVVLLKHSTAILDFGFERSVNNVKRIIESTITDRALEAAAAELEAKDKALLLGKSFAGRSGAQAPPESIDPVDPRREAVVISKKACGIKHPYIGILTLKSLEVQLVNHVTVMAYMGPSLSQSKVFMSDWLKNPGKRMALFEDVGQSALNLVEKLEFCHNDIRPTNITVLENRFCLIDYDNCRDVTAPLFDKSPLLNGINKASDQAMMLLSVAQIAMVSFGLETSEKLASSAWDVWLVGDDKKTECFDSWVAETGLGGVFTRTRPAQRQYGRAFMEEMLRRMLRLEPATR